MTEKTLKQRYFEIMQLFNTGFLWLNSEKDTVDLLTKQQARIEELEKQLKQGDKND